MPVTEFEGSDEAALEYIRKRGYCSYSSMKNVRDKNEPSSYSSEAQNLGKELHSRLLEGIKTATLSPGDEALISILLSKLRSHPVVKILLANSKNEVEFKEKVYGVNTLGYLDIDNRPDNISDLKSTSCTSMKAFVAQMDFLQAALYMRATGSKNFYYIGACKIKPYPIMVFNVLEYPDTLQRAQIELLKVLTYIKSKL